MLSTSCCGSKCGCVEVAKTCSANAGSGTCSTQDSASTSVQLPIAVSAASTQVIQTVAAPPELQTADAQTATFQCDANKDLHTKDYVDNVALSHQNYEGMNDNSFNGLSKATDMLQKQITCKNTCNAHCSVQSQSLMKNIKQYRVFYIFDEVVECCFKKVEVSLTILILFDKSVSESNISH